MEVPDWRHTPVEVQTKGLADDAVNDIGGQLQIRMDTFFAPELEKKRLENEEKRVDSSDGERKANSLFGRSFDSMIKNGLGLDFEKFLSTNPLEPPFIARIPLHCRMHKPGWIHTAQVMHPQYSHEQGST